MKTKSQRQKHFFQTHKGQKRLKELKAFRKLFNILKNNDKN